MAWTAPKTWARNDPLNADNLNTFIRDNQNYLHDNLGLSGNTAHRVRTVSGSDVALSVNDDVFGAPTLDLTLNRAASNVLAGCQVTLRDTRAASADMGEFQLRLRAYQQTPLKTVDVQADYNIGAGALMSLIPSTVFLGFAAGVMSFTVTLTAGSNMSLLTGDHTIWAMEF